MRTVSRARDANSLYPLSPSLSLYLSLALSLSLSIYIYICHLPFCVSRSRSTYILPPFGQRGVDPDRSSLVLWCNG